MGLQLANFIRGRLAAAVTTSSTTLTLTAASFPTLAAGDYCFAVLQSAINRSVCEIIKVTAVSGTSITVVRALEGTTARAFAVGDFCELRITAAQLQAYENHINTATLHAPAFVAEDYNKYLTPSASGLVWQKLTPALVGSLALTGGALTGALTSNSSITATSFVGPLSGNATTASTLQTARIITIGPTGKSFSGAANISWTAAEMAVVSLTGTETISGIKTFTGANTYSGVSKFSNEIQAYRTAYTDPDSGVTRAIKIGDRGMAVLGGIKTDSLAASGNVTASSFTGPLTGDVTGAVTGNASTATTLQTARTLTLGLTGKAFDGSANVSWTLAEIGALPLTGGTVTGTVTATAFAGPLTGAVTGNATTATTLQTARTLTLGLTGKTFNGSANVAWTLAEIGALPLTGGTVTGNITAPTFIGALTGNASTATTLQTSRTFSVSGDATGSAAFNGSANAAIALTLAASGVSAGTYRSVTVDAKGRVTAGTNPTTLSGYGITDAAPNGYGLGTNSATVRGDINVFRGNGWREYNVDAGDTNGPQSYGNVLDIGHWSNAASSTGWGAQLFIATGGQVYVRTNANNGSFAGSGWNTIYSSAYKPTAADVGAVAVTGGTITGQLNVSGGLAVTGNEKLQGNLQVGNVPGAGYAWGSTVIASQDYFVEVKGSGSLTGSTGYVFHNPNVSTAAITYKNTADDVGYFNFSSDDTSWDVRINNEVVPTVSRSNQFSSEQRFANGTYYDPDYRVEHAIKVGAGGIAVNGASVFNGPTRFTSGTFTGAVGFTASLFGDGKRVLDTGDGWLRINGGNEFTAGIFCGNGILRTDGNFQVGGNGSALNVTATGDMSLAGGFTLGGNITFTDSGTTKRGVFGTVGSNDFWFIGGGATASNAGYMEIATGDDGQQAGAAEPIYVSQYGPGDPLTGKLYRRAALLDANGNTSFPGTVTAPTITVSGNIQASTISATTFTGYLNGGASYTKSSGDVTAETGSNTPTLGGGLTMQTAYNNGYPETYGNVLTMYGAGATQLMLGWSATSNSSVGNHAGVYVRSQRDCCGALWSDWARVYTTAYKPSANDVGAMADGGTYGTVILNNWIRTTGSTGWYNNTYGGGITMEDGTWVRVYGGKSFYVQNANENAVTTEGGYRSAGNGFWHDNQSAHVWALRTGWPGQPSKDAFWGGVVSGNGDGATSTTANVKMLSWYGIGFGPSIEGQTIPQFENAVYINVRTGDLTARGLIYANGNGNFNDVYIRSDRRLKTNIEPLRDATAKLRKLVGCLFDKKNTIAATETTRDVGLIAQDVQAVQPEATREVEETGMLTIAPMGIIALLVEGFKELDARISALEAR